MKVSRIILLLMACTLSFSNGAKTKTEAMLSWADLQQRAAKFGTVLTLPTFESTPAEVSKTTDEAIAKADKALAAIGSLNSSKVTFRNTFRALDDIQSDVEQQENRIEVLSQAHPDAKMREAAIEADEKFSSWGVGVDYRKDVYKAVKRSLRPIRHCRAKTGGCSRNSCAITGGLGWTFRMICRKK